MSIRHGAVTKDDGKHKISESTSFENGESSERDTTLNTRTPKKNFQHLMKEGS